MDNAPDLKLIANNWEILLPAAESGFETKGRGTVLVDTTRIESGGHPIRYVNLNELPNDDAECGRMVRIYDPQTEIVISLYRDDGRVYSYQLGRPVGSPKLGRK